MNTNNPQEFAACMGIDALRLCLGISPRNFTVAEVIRWMRTMNGCRELKRRRP